MTTQNIPRTCSLENCDRPLQAKQLCDRHYYRLRTYGDPTASIRRSDVDLTVEERFWSRVDKSAGQGPDGDCWEWQAGQVDGYGAFVYPNGTRAHRASYEFTYGRSLTQMGMHTCDNRLCVKPTHIIDGSLQDNLAQRDERGRQARGEGHAMAVLKESDIRAIRASKLSRLELQHLFQVSKSSIARIRRNESWTHIK